MAAAASVSVVLTVPSPSSPQQLEDSKAADVAALTQNPKGKNKEVPKPVVSNCTLRQGAQEIGSSMNKEELFFTAEYPRFRSNASSPVEPNAVSPIQHEVSETTEVKASTLRELPLSILLPGVSVPEASSVPITSVAPTGASPMQHEVGDINSSPYTTPDGLVIYGSNEVTYLEDRYRDMIAKQRRYEALKAAMIAEGNGLPDAKTVSERDAIIESIKEDLTARGSTELEKATAEWRIRNACTTSYMHAIDRTRSGLEALERQALKAYTLMNDLRTRGT